MLQVGRQRQQRRRVDGRGRVSAAGGLARQGPALAHRPRHVSALNSLSCLASSIYPLFICVRARTCSLHPRSSLALGTWALVFCMYIQYMRERREAACERNSYALDGAAASFRASTASLSLRYFQWNKADWHQCGVAAMTELECSYRFMYSPHQMPFPKLHDLTLTGLFCHFYGHSGARKIVGTKKVVFSDFKSAVRTYSWSLRVHSFSASHLEYTCHTAVFCNHNLDHRKNII
jgi:hypothetical protein